MELFLFFALAPKMDFNCRALYRSVYGCQFVLWTSTGRFRNNDCSRNSTYESIHILWLSQARKPSWHWFVVFENKFGQKTERIRPIISDSIYLYLLCCCLGLIKLPEPIQLNVRIQPAKLPTSCILPHLGGERVIAIGNGGTQFEEYTAENPWDPRLRQFNSTTMTSKDCNSHLGEEEDINAIVCIGEDEMNYGTTFHGDSGNFLHTHTHTQTQSHMRKFTKHGICFFSSRWSVDTWMWRCIDRNYS